MRGLGTAAVVAALCVAVLAEHTNTLKREDLKDIDKRLARLRRFRDAKLEHMDEKYDEAPAFVPRKEKKIVAPPVDSACDPGWTGMNCLNAVCKNETYPFYTHDGYNEGMGDLIQTDVGPRCEERFTFPVDASMPTDVFITVDSVKGGRPYVRLYDPQGTEVQPCGDLVLSDDSTVQKYCMVRTGKGDGLYTIQLFSEQQAACSFEVTAPTILYADGGFVLTPQDDVVPEFLPGDNQGIMAYPMQGNSYFFAFKLTHDVFPVSPQVLHIYENGRWNRNFDLQTRYHCATPHITVQSFNCTQINYYYAVFQGVDENGNQWQRIYNFECDYALPTGTVTYPTPTTYTECYNDGVLSMNGSCYCGPFYEGPQCELKLCMNGGELDFQNNKCLCDSGYTGDYCENVKCTSPRYDAMDTRYRALGFVIRSSQSMQAQLDQIVAAATNITAAFSAYHTGYLQSFVLSVVQNNGVLFTHEFLNYNDFISSIRSMTHPPVDTECNDALLLGVSEVLEQPTFQKYPKSPIFIFSDGTASDSDDVRYQLLQDLSYYRGQLFFMLSDSVTGRCNIALNDPGYEQMRGLAAFSQGQVVKVNVNDIAASATALAESTYMMNELITNDLEDCRKAPKYNAFFVDENTDYLVISATGDKLSVLITAPNRTVFKPRQWFQAGNLFLWAVDTPIIGNYLISMSTLSADKTVCQYRVTARSNYDLFIGVTTSLTSDEVAKQPTWRERSHLVAHINHFWNPDVLNYHAEAIVTTNDVGGQRQVVYASSGIYRDLCNYYLYFGEFVCRVPNMMYYVQVYLTDQEGNTVVRTTTAFCSASAPTSIPADGCANGGVNVNGTCICPNHFAGPKCQQIVCEHLGTPLLGSCQCPAGFAGTFCELPACNAFNNYEHFNEHRKSLSVLIHDSISTRSVFRTLNSTMSRVMDDIRYLHHEWITSFQLVRFNDTSYSTAADGPDPNDFIKGMSQLAQHNYDNSDYSCQDLNLLPTLYAALSSMDVSFGGIVYIFINGLPKIDSQALGRIYNHLESTKSTIHVIQTSTSPCGADITDPRSTLLMSLAEFTSGRFTLTMANKAGDVFRSLPTLYRSQLVTENYYSDCTKPTTFYVPVDGLTQSLDVVIAGDLVSDPVYTTPDGGKYNVVNLWNDIGYGARGDQVIQPCDQGWDQYDNRCFKFGLTKLSWDDAASVCHQEGASLASVFNQGDQDFLSYQAGSAIDYWIGLNDEKTVGTFVWDSPFNFSLTLDATGYKNWATGQPVSDPAKQCVFDSQSGTIQPKGWNAIACSTRMSYVCQKHVYNQFFEPRDPNSDLLPRGIWKVTVQTDEGGCSVGVTAQSQLRVFTRYTTNIHDDFGYAEPFQGTDNNRIVAHVEGIIGSTTRSLEYAHFYQNNLTIIQAEPMNNRGNCLYQFISSNFSCPTPSFQMMMSGVDDYGYLYQRIIPVSCLGGPTPSDCENGAVYYKGECICPPGFYGEFCQVADCQNGGRVKGDLKTCDCPSDFSGRFCELPVCTRNGNSPDLDDDHRTLVIILDGAQNGLMKNVLDNFATIFKSVVSSAQTQYGSWFTNYVGVVIKDANASKHGNQTVSPVVTQSDPDEFVRSLMTVVTNAPYIAPSGGRSIYAGVIAALSSPLVKVRSTAFVITTGNQDDDQDEDLALDTLSKTHTQVNLIVVGDQQAPGNAPWNTLDPLFNLMHTSGGSVYLVHDDTTLQHQWTQIILTLHRSYYVLSTYRRDCSNLDEFIQSGANSSALVIDIFSETPPTLSISDPQGNANKPMNTLSTNFNTLDIFATINKPGIWKLGLDDNKNKSGVCMVNIRGQSTLDVLVAFTQDVAEDGGLHSNDAYLFPQAGFEQNAIVATANGGTLSYVQLFDIEERRLRFAAPLIPRKNCAYPYISQSVFRCDRHSFAVAIDGLDFEGHPFRRMFTIHCIGFIPTRPIPTGTFPPYTGTFPARTTTAPLPVYPTCSSSVPKIDLVVAIDSSLTMPREDFTKVIDGFYELAATVQFDSTHTRVLLGTYDSAAHFEGQDFNNTVSISTFLTRIVELSWTGYTGNDGNNIQGVLDYITKSESKVTPFRVDARKMVFLISTIGWDKGNYYNGAEHGYPDPSADAAALAQLNVEFFPVGWGDQANLAQLQALSKKCARVAKTPRDLQDAMNYFYSTLCSPTPVC